MSFVVNSGEYYPVGTDQTYLSLKDVIINSAGSVFVTSGGYVSKVTVNNSGHLGPLEIVDDVTVNAGAIISYYPAATVFFVTRDNGHIERISRSICSGNISGLGFVGSFRAQNAVMSDCVFDGQANIGRAYADVYDTTVAGGSICGSAGNVAYLVLHSRCSASGTLVAGGVLSVGSGAAIRDVTVDDGKVWVASSGSASGTVLSGGIQSVYIGANAYGTVLRGGTQYVGGSAVDTVVSSGGINYMTISGVGIRTRVLDGGTEIVAGGCSEMSTYVAAGGSMQVFGTVTDVEIRGEVTVSTGVVSGAAVRSGGEVIAYLSGNVRDVTFDNGGTMTLLGGTVSNATFASGARLNISNAGTISGAVFEPGAEFSASAQYNNVQIYDAVMFNDVVQDSHIGLFRAELKEGVTLTMTSGAYGGYLNTASGVTVNVLSGGTCSSSVISSGAVMNIMSGAYIIGNALVGGTMNFSCCNYFRAAASDGVINNVGGSATSTTVFDGGKVTATAAATENHAVVSGGVLEILDGSLLFAGSMFGGHTLIGSGALASRTAVYDGGVLFVESGARAVELYVNGSATVCCDVSGATVRNGGVLYASSATVGGYNYISSGGRLIADGLTAAGSVYMYSSSILEFALAEREAGGAALVDDFGKFSFSGEVCITVSAEQAQGDYKLAENVAAFDKTVTICTTDGVCGTLTVGASVTLADRKYALDLVSDALTLAVDGAAPIAGVTPGDLNGDGRADIVMTISQTGHGAEGATGAWLIQADQTAAWGDLSQRNAGWSIFGTGVTDAGKTTNDIYVKSADNVVGAWVTDDAGAVAGWVTVGEFDADTQVLGLGDFDGDGQTDLLLRNTNGAVGCFLTDGTGWNYFQSLGDEWTVCAVGDLNGDGRSDVVLKHDAGFAGSWLTQSDCTMAWADLDTLPEGFAIVGAGDFDGDGTSDVLLKNGNYYGAWIVQNGNAKSWMGLGDLGDVTVEQIADFDADGIDDLRIRTAAGDLGAQLVKGADNLEWKYYGSVGEEWSTSLAAI